jgi:hypothetical protein
MPEILLTEAAETATLLLRAATTQSPPSNVKFEQLSDTTVGISAASETGLSPV